MNVPVGRVEFERRVRAWVGQDAAVNQRKLRSYLTRHWPGDNAVFDECELDVLCECLWTCAQSKSRLWSEEGLDEFLIELRNINESS